METAFGDFCKSIASQNNRNVLPSNSSCCSFILGNKSTNEADYCTVCAELCSFVRANSSTGRIVEGTPFTVDKTKYIICRVPTRDNAIKRYQLSNRYVFFTEVVFAFSCKDKSFVCYRYFDQAPSVQKKGNEIRKFLKENCPNIRNCDIQPYHVRQIAEDEYCVDPEPFVLFCPHELPSAIRSDENPFVCLLFSYINQNIDNIDIVGRFYHDTATLKEIKAQAKTGRIRRTESDYLNLVSL